MFKNDAFYSSGFRIVHILFTRRNYVYIHVFVMFIISVRLLERKNNERITFLREGR